MIFISTGLWVYKTSATNIFILIEIYFIARFTKLHLQGPFKTNAWLLFLISASLFYGVVIIGYLNQNLIIMPYINSYYNPIIILLVGSLIVLFDKIKFSSKTVNWLTPNILAVYLITENSYAFSLFNNWFYVAGEYPIINFFGISLFLSLLCVLIDKMRLFMMDTLEKRWSVRLLKWLY